jgi:hypothetical protein
MLSSFAFKLNLRRYMEGALPVADADADVDAGGAEADAREHDEHEKHMVRRCRLTLSNPR